MTARAGGGLNAVHGRLDTRKADVAAAVAFLLVAGVLLWESVRLGAGWGPSGPQPGFFPALASLLMAAGAAGAGLQAVRGGAGEPFLEGPEEASELVRVGLPMVAAVAAIAWLGFYVVAALYVSLFVWWYGRYRWYLSLPSGVILAGLLYWTFERAFKVFLPKSIFYGTWLPF